MAAALLGAAVATTTLLTNEPLGLSLTPRLETELPTRSVFLMGLPRSRVPPETGIVAAPAARGSGGGALGLGLAD